MPRLKCGVSSCLYWHDKFCIRDGISVKGDTALQENETHCGSYKKRERESADKSYNLEIGRLGDADKHLDVNCEAVNCLFNRSLLCQAKDIKIDGTRAKNSRETFCSSFELK